MATPARPRTPDRRWPALAVIVALLATLAPTSADAIPPAGIITTVYQHPNTSHGIFDIAMTPDGTTYLLRSSPFPSLQGPKVSRLNDDGTLSTIHSGINCPFDQEIQPPGLFCGVLDMAAGPDGNLYVLSNEFSFCFCGGPAGSYLWRLTPQGSLTRIGGGGGSDDDGIAATSAQLRSPQAVAVGDDGAIFIAEQQFGKIRKIDTDGIITTIAGTRTPGFSGDGGPAIAAQFSAFRGIAVSPEGEIFVHANRRIRKIDKDGIVTTIAGTGSSGYTGDGGPAIAAQINNGQIEIGPDGDLYLLGGARVRVIDAEGIIDTVAGTGANGSTGDGGPAPEAQVAASGLDFDPTGDLILVDATNRNVRRVTWHGIVEGTVLDAGGDPAAGVVVSLLADWPAWLVIDTTVTDTSGHYRFEGVDPGSYRVRVFDPQGRFERSWWNGETTYRSAGTATSTIGALTTADLTAPPWTTGALRGRVTDTDTAQPLPGAVVAVFTTDGYVAGTTTGPNGYYHLRGLPADDYRVRFQGPTPESHTPEWFDDSPTATGGDIITLGATTITADATLEPVD